MVDLNIRRFPDRQMKYGVICKERLLEDLRGWTNLYTAGRLQKPVHVIIKNPTIEAAIALNKENAIRTSLLLLPTKFTEFGEEEESLL